MNIYIEFHNNTELPINVNSWVNGSRMLECWKVNPGEKRIVPSSVGEWYLDSMFEDLSQRQIWIEKGFDQYFSIGKIRSSPCSRGNYSFMEYLEPFECIFTPSESSNSLENNNIEGIATFIQNK